MTLRLESVRAAELIGTVVDALAPSIGDKEIELKTNCDRAPKSVKTDSLRLQQILTNLVSNAIRYTEKGTVTVTSYVMEANADDPSADDPSADDPSADSGNTSASDGRWVIAVSDTGIGISKNDLSKVFEPYAQVGDPQEHPNNSSGLGLTIVNKLVQLLQGQISVESVLAEGSTFTVILPLQLDL